MQEHVDILRGTVGWDVHKPEANSISFEINNQRPLNVTIAIATDNRHRWPERFDLPQNAGRTNIPQMSDFIRALRQRGNHRWRPIVRIGHYENLRHNQMESLAQSPPSFTTEGLRSLEMTFPRERLASTRGI